MEKQEEKQLPAEPEERSEQVRRERASDERSEVTNDPPPSGSAAASE